MNWLLTTIPSAPTVVTPLVTRPTPATFLESVTVNPAGSPSLLRPKNERAAIFGQYDHVRVYGKDYGNFLTAAGFEFEAIDYTKLLGPEKVAQYGLAAGELIPLVRKPIV